MPGTGAVPSSGAKLSNLAEARELKVNTRQRSPLTRGLKALDFLREQPATVRELAEVLCVNRSTAHRLAQELEQAGYIQRLGSSRRYAIAPGKLVAAPRSTDESASLGKGPIGDWGEVSFQALRELRDLLGESTMFAVPARDRMLYVAFFSTDQPIGVQEAIGSTRPMHASAVGKAYLSALPFSVLDIVLGRLDYTVGTENAASGPFQLRDMLDEVREQGYAVDHDETFVGLSCVATPVIVNGSALVGAAGITGLTHRFRPQRATEFGALLVERLREVEAR